MWLTWQPGAKPSSVLGPIKNYELFKSFYKLAVVALSNEVYGAFTIQRGLVALCIFLNSRRSQREQLVVHFGRDMTRMTDSQKFY